MRFPKTIHSILALSLCFTSGCASIVSGGPKVLPILSQPDDAACEIVDLKSGATITKARTPHTVTLANDAGYFQPAKYKVKISKDGYLPREVELSAGLNGWYLGNIVFGGVLGILIIDPATGAMWKIHEDNVSVALYLDTDEGRKAMHEEEVRIEQESREKKETLVRMGQ